ncbi:GC-rich sequence DNA-binding factor 2 [Brienomyrus brachyistius]|uniref:GC-rich sequence DNA-binding factor 2 n=1 Tax=Brienomyrus brachyistius TaxID=42636 RepID=UPI0020B1C133|nr:GC-rich sequence DNA-binding factor 2 [Brienomyrus brachyistius]
MFNKRPKRNFRQRKHESSDEEEGNRNGNGAEDGKEAPASLRSQDRGVSCSSRPEVVIPKADSSGCEDARSKTDDPAKLDFPKKRNIFSFSEDKEADGCEFKVKKSAEKEVVFKARKKEDSPAKELHPKAQKDADAINLSSEEDSKCIEVDEEMRKSENDSSSPRSTPSRTSEPRPGVIPDARQIRAARKHRRKARTQRDYIPLDGNQGGTSGEGEDEEEDDDDDDDDFVGKYSDDEPDDHQRRIQFAPKSKSIRERIAEKIGGSESECDSPDSEEEDDRTLWEEQQIGKGVRRHKFPDGSNSRDTVKPKKKVDIPQSLPAVSIDVIRKRITGRLESLREVHRAHEAEYQRMQLDMESAKASSELLESGSSDEQHKFYRGMRVYVQNLTECLTEKIVPINAAEMEMHTLLIDQAEALMSRRREAVRKESTHLQQLVYNTDPVITEVAEKNLTEISEQSTVSQNSDLEAGCEGGCEPLTHEKVELERKRAEILRRSQEIFADVQEEFSDVKKILSRFAEWRVLFPESYYNAYISLCIPKLLGPLIRHQLICWNPLMVDSEDFESLPWYSAVEKFCHGQGYEESDNADKETLPSIIQKSILPKIEGFVELTWDPLSSGQCHCLVNLCQRLQDDYHVFDGEQNKNAKAFLEAVTTRLRSAVDEDVYVPLYPKKFLDDKTWQAYRFQDRQFWSAVKLLGNITLWDGLVPENVLMELALDKLLNRYLMMVLLNAPPEKESLEKCKKVAACFPKSWFTEAESHSSIPQLQNFIRHLLQTTHSLCEKDPDVTSQREVIADVLTVLRSLNALDSIANITEKYHYKDV